MKKSIITLSLCLIFYIGSIHGSSYGASVNKKHWADDLVSKSLIDEYFKPLDRMDYKRIQFDKDISTYILDLAYGKLFEKYEMTYEMDTSSMYISRIDFANTIYKNLLANGFIREGHGGISFTDVKGKDNILALGDLYNWNIIRGSNSLSFRPDDNIRQAEAFVILDNIESLLSSVEELPYEVKENIKTDLDTEYLNMKSLDDTYVVELVKNYNVDSKLELVRVEQTKHNIDLIFSESKGNKLERAYSRKLNIVIDRKALKGSGPFNFRVKGMDFPSSL